MIDFINGKKTYIVGLALVAYALLGICLGQLDMEAAGVLVFNAFGILGIRHAVAKLE